MYFSFYFLIFFSIILNIFSFIQLCFNYNLYKILNLFSYILLWLISIILLFFFKKTFFLFSILISFYTFDYLNISYILGLDIISLFFLLLSCFIIILCFLFNVNLKYKILLYSFLLNLTLFILINVFLTLDLFLFFFFFEMILIPVYFFMLIWGSRKRRIYAAYQLFFYTLAGSIFFFLGILLVYSYTGSSFFNFFLYSSFLNIRQFLIWIFFFLGFSVKIPMMPLHLWLPEAHVESPTIGSVILAALVLKFGTYAMLRLLIPSYLYISFDFIYFFLVFFLLSFIYASVLAFVQIDLKKIIAYSSIAHMNFSLIGLFSQTFLGLSGAFFLMFGHAITSSALFLSVGLLYDRYKSRIIFYYGSLIKFMPIFSIFFCIFLLSNLGFPSTFNFVGEFFILSSSFFLSTVISLISLIGLFLSLLYSLFFYNRIIFGNYNYFIRYFSDCSRLEFYILNILIIFILFFGLFPNFFFSYSSFTLARELYLQIII